MFAHRVLIPQSSSQLACCPQRPAQLRARPVVVAGIKKETKKLTKTLKSHRKRLESLLSAQATLMAPTGTAIPQLSQAELHAVLSEIAQLQTALAAVRHQQRQLASMQAVSDSSCSSDSDSDCEDGPKQQRKRMGAKMQPVQQLQGLQQLQAGTGSSQTCAQQNVGTAVAAASMAPVADSSSMGSVVLQAPLIDQEQPDLCRQLPRPQQYTTTGRVLVCQGKACLRKGALQVLQAVSHATAASPGVEVLPCKCLGKCKQGPAMRVRTEGQQRSSLVTEVEPLEVPEVLDQLLG